MKPANILQIFFISFSLLACNSNTTMKENVNANETNETLEIIFARKSVRTYQDREVEKEKIDTLLRAAMAAPSGKDVRPWHFIVVQDRTILDSLAAQLPYGKMLAKTNQAIIVCGDSSQSSYWYLDCAIASQNILLAAESMGLGAVYTAAYPYEDRMGAVIEHTNLPENILPLCVIPFGYPAKDEKPKDKFDESRIHYNKF